MNGLLDSAGFLWLGIAAVAVALGLFTHLLLRPSNQLPLERRRPGVAPEPNPLERAANAATGSVERLLSGRGGGAALILERAGVKTPLRELVILVAAAGLALGALGLLLSGPVAGLLLAILAPVLGRLWLVVLTARRQAAFGEQLDETLQMLAGSLRAGYSLLQAVSAVSTEAAQPTSEEFARVINETRVGRSLAESLEEAARRMGNEDFYWVTQAIAINREIGGNLADVLDGVGRTIRERNALRRQVKALSAEGRLSAIILMALPLVIALLLSVLNPSYLAKLLENAVGWLMIAAGVLLLLVGGFWLSRVVKIKF